MRIRGYRRDDAAVLARIYRDAVTQIGARAYSSSEAAAWAAAADDVAAFARALARGTTLVAETAHGDTAAFGQLEPDDRIAMLYTAPGFARASYASSIYRMLEDEARRRGVAVLRTEASRTARRFFEKQGFELVRTETVNRGGVALETLRMSKRLDAPEAPPA